MFIYIKDLLTYHWERLRPPAIERVITHEIRDPSGLAARDIAIVRRHVQEVHWKPGTTIEQVAYAQGQHDLLRIIEQRVMGKGNDLPE
jgi:hypothetical protein